MASASAKATVPTLDVIRDVISKSSDNGLRPTLVPVYRQISSDLITPSAAYLKVSAHAAAVSSPSSFSSPSSSSAYSFLFESAATEQVGRYSFVGANPRSILTTGPGHGPETDPLPLLERELARHVVAHVPGLQLPPLTGGAIGYVGYDCVRYFEPKTARPLKDVLQIPESLFMLFDTIVAFDRFYGVIKVISYVKVPPSDGADGENDSGSAAAAATGALETAYRDATASIDELVRVLERPEVPMPPQGPVQLGREATSNIGRQGYEAHVSKLKEHILRGDIFQAVPSQRFARPTDLHPFNIYRHLRTVNPSPYLFYIDCRDFQIIGASPELLVKTSDDEDNVNDHHSDSDHDGDLDGDGTNGHRTDDLSTRRIVTHPIAGTVPRGADADEDRRLADTLRGSIKDRAEHVMLVDLARNDVNRVADPHTVRVDRLLGVERFSHVQHLVSQVSGVLRPGRTRFDAFRSIFPAGTVSGAPKVRAMELIAELEREKRGVYAGAVGYFGYDTLGPQRRRRLRRRRLRDDAAADAAPDVRLEGHMDTCIALRTMLYKDGVAYLQAGGGIVLDSVEYDEWMETINKLGASMHCIKSAEEMYHAVQNGAD